MADIRVGTAGWTDKTLIESGWYPGDATNPEQRLKYYASQFPLVEVDSAYYALPAERTAQAWAERTPDHFTFNVKAYSLFTQHPTPVKSLPADLREEAGKAGKDRVYLKDVGAKLADEAWNRFLSALEPLHQAGKLGAILLQFPPWFPIGRANKQYILDCAERVKPRRVCVEFRNSTWMTDDNQEETLDVPVRPPAAVRVRGRAAGLLELGPAGARGHQRPRRRPAARALRALGRQDGRRAVQLPLQRPGADGVGG